MESNACAMLRCKPSVRWRKAVVIGFAGGAPDGCWAARSVGSANANIAILNYSDILRRFLPNSSVTMADLDGAVKACIDAKTACVGYEINEKTMNKDRKGDVVADILGFHRETETTGWMFNGLVLVKSGVVIYTLTGGQPDIKQHEETTSMLGPVQGLSQKLFGF